MLPADTVAYVRIADMPEMIERFQDTSIGRISRDEQVQPLLTHLWGSLESATEEMEEELGVSLSQLLAIPQGETALALIMPKEGQPALVLLLDAGDRMPLIDKIMERVEEGLAEQGATRKMENVEGMDLVVHDLPGGRERQFNYVKEDGTLLICTNSEVAKGLIATWKGSQGSTLADNTKFTSIMRRCIGDEGVAPQITFFIDALELTKRVAGGNLAGQTFLALLPALGLDGVRGFGGSIAFSTEQYDSVAHMHLLLDNPRKGIPEMLTLRGGDLQPESWVPSDAVTYTSLNWDVDTSYAALKQLYDAIRGEGALERDLGDRISQPLGIEFEEELVAALEGRLTLATWNVKPARLNSRANLVGIKLKDTKAFRKTWKRVTEKLTGQLEKDAFGSTEFWTVSTPRSRREQPEGALIRRPDPAIAIVGDYLLLSDSTDFLKHAIATKSDGSSSLASELDFKLIASKVRRQNGGGNPGLLSFNRPEEGMRLLYELAASESTRERLSTGAEDNEVFGALDRALRENELPPFSVIARYLAPGGSLITNDETGFHYMSFTLRRN
jgi:hypothetical protein